MPEAESVLLGVSWQDTMWLHHCPLNADTVLDYFSHSQVAPRLAQLHVCHGVGHVAPLINFACAPAVL